MKDEQFLTKYIQDEYEIFTKGQLLDMLKDYKEFLTIENDKKVKIDESKVIVREPIMIKRIL